MQDSSLSAVFGALSNEKRMATIANNLANVNTTAFKKDTMAFHDVFSRYAHDYVVTTKSFLRDEDMFPQPTIMAKPRLSDQAVDFSQGGFQKTGNQLDFALAGDGFFTVQAGEERLYTRAGNFLIDADGTLVTQQGQTVLVDGGPLEVPPGASIAVDDGGNISINGEAAGAFDLVTFDDLGKMERVGGNLYRNTDGAEVPPEDLSVRQGYTEKANVEVVTEMVSMIETQRAFEAYAKILQGTDSMDKDMITKLARATG